MSKLNTVKDYRSENPHSAPPKTQPVYCRGSLKPMPELLKPCIKTYIYIWLVNGGSFWMFPQNIIDNMLCGLIWSGESWEPACFGFKLIKSFY